MEIIDVVVPGLGESITEVQIGVWLKREGEAVEVDEALVEIESEKATLDLPSPAAGVLREVLRATGERVRVGEVIGRLERGAAKAAAPGEPDAVVMPAARAAAGRLGIDAAAVPGSGPGGRVLKEDVLRAAAQPVAPSEPSGPVEGERVVPMSPLRRTIARRLVEARQTAALLTTFNEIDMLAVRELRASAGEEFRERHGVGLGFLSIFVQAAVEALRQFPEVGARVEGENIVYPGRYDIGIAVGGGKGLVVPVLRGADRLSLAKIEAAIRDFGERARQGTILPAELEGGVFSISNGGIYGSLFSTPIVNPPQSGILGLHAIQDRPVARDGQVVIRPMMYVALTYDHRIVDGREAVGFLRGIKLRVEDPRRLLLGL